MAESLIIFLPVKDIEKTKDFYINIAEFNLYKSQSGGKCLIFDSGYGYIGFCEYNDGRKALSGEKGVCISVNLESRKAVDEKYIEVKKSDVVIEGEPKHLDKFGVYSFFVRDPDDYRLEFQKLD